MAMKAYGTGATQRLSQRGTRVCGATHAPGARIAAAVRAQKKAARRQGRGEVGAWFEDEPGHGGPSYYSHGEAGDEDFWDPLEEPGEYPDPAEGPDPMEVTRALIRDQEIRAWDDDGYDDGY